MKKRILDKLHKSIDNAHEYFSLLQAETFQLNYKTFLFCRVAPVWCTFIFPWFCVSSLCVFFFLFAAPENELQTRIIFEGIFLSMSEYSPLALHWNWRKKTIFCSVECLCIYKIYALCSFASILSIQLLRNAKYVLQIKPLHTHTYTQAHNHFSHSLFCSVLFSTLFFYWWFHAIQRSTGINSEPIQILNEKRSIYNRSNVKDTNETRTQMK